MSERFIIIIFIFAGHRVKVTASGGLLRRHRHRRLGHSLMSFSFKVGSVRTVIQIIDCDIPTTASDPVNIVFLTLEETIDLRFNSSVNLGFLASKSKLLLFERLLHLADYIL